MHGTISQDLCEILPKRLPPAVHTDDPVWVPTVFTHNRDRLLEGEDFNPPDTPS